MEARVRSAADLQNRQPTNPQASLTPRQLEVLALLSEGLPNKLISRRLKIAGGTVKVHVVQILRALGVSSRLQAVVEARRLGLVERTGDSEMMQNTSFLKAEETCSTSLDAVRNRLRGHQTELAV